MAEREGSIPLESGTISDQLPPNTLLPTLNAAIKDKPDQKFVVGFEDGPDPSNPLNWSSRYKWTVIIILASVKTIGQVSPSMREHATNLRNVPSFLASCVKHSLPSSATKINLLSRHH